MENAQSKRTVREEASGRGVRGEKRCELARQERP